MKITGLIIVLITVVLLTIAGVVVVDNGRKVFEARVGQINGR